MMTEEKRGCVGRILLAPPSPSEVAAPRVEGIEGGVGTSGAGGGPAGPPGSGPPGQRGPWRRRDGSPARCSRAVVVRSAPPQFILRSHSSKRAGRVRGIPGSAGGPVHPIILFQI